METYTTWETVPDHLATKSQLAKAGLKLAPGQSRVAIKTGGYGPYDLYDKRTAVPKRASSQAQREAAQRNIEKARKALYCLDCHVYGERLIGGRCRGCCLLWEAQTRAQEWFADIIGRDDWLIVDTETTGLDEDAEIVQIGIVAHDGRVLLDQLVRPSGEISPGATAVHGLTAGCLASAPAWPAVYPEVLQLLDGKLLLAYNAEFDSRIVRQTCKKYGLPTPANEWECVMERFAQWYGEWSSYWRDFRWVKLVIAAEMRGVETADLHDAAGDALLAWRVVQSFNKKD